MTLNIANVANAVSQFLSLGSALRPLEPPVRQMIQERDLPGIAGAAWVAWNGLRGVLRSRSPVDPRSLPPASEGFQFSDQPPLVLQLLQAALGQDHVVYNLWGLYETFRSIGLAQGEYARVVGLQKYFEDYLATSIEGAPRLPGNERFIESMRVIYSEWVMRYARSNGLNVCFEGTEKIPKEGHVVYVMALHVAIWIEFWFTYADPRLVPVADAYNFRDNKDSRHFGVPLVADGNSAPLLDRDNPRDKVRIDHLIDASLKYGRRPGWFINGERVTPSWCDDGTPDRPVAFSSVPDSKNVENYFQTGGVFANALGLAIKSGEPVKIVVVTLRGTECMPKIAKKFPFIQRNRSGSKKKKVQIVYRVVDSLTILPTDRQRRILEVGSWISRTVRDDLESDAHVRGFVSQWCEKSGFPEAAKLFEERSAREEIYLTIAGRIRSIHPSRVERGRFIEKLIALTRRMPAPTKGELEEFLTEVSNVMKPPKKAQHPLTNHEKKS